MLGENIPALVVLMEKMRRCYHVGSLIVGYGPEGDWVNISREGNGQD
jgi:hypothetical protein